MRRINTYCLLICVLVILSLASSCSNLYDPRPEPRGLRISLGLALSGPSRITYTPQFPDYPLSKYQVVILTITGPGYSEEYTFEDLYNDSYSVRVDIPHGDYTISAKAYLNSNDVDPDNYEAFGSIIYNYTRDSNFVTLFLEPVIEGSGTLRYKLTDPSGPATAFLIHYSDSSDYPFPGTAEGEQEKFQLSLAVDGNYHTISPLDAGYYALYFRGKSPNVVHIYKNLETEIVDSIAVTDVTNTPVAEPSGGIVEPGAGVTLDCDAAGSFIFYTTDGTIPDTSSTRYSNSIVISESSTTIKAIAIRPGMHDSDVMSETYLYKVSTPTASPAAEEVAYGTAVSLSAVTPGAAIRYTTDNSEPENSGSGALYTSPIGITLPSVTIKAVAIKDKWATSDTLNVTYKLFTRTVNFNMNYTDAVNATVPVTDGSPLGDSMPEDPVRTDHIFKGWNTAANGSGTSFTDATVVSGNITVYAQWEQISLDSITVTTPPTKTVYLGGETLNLNGLVITAHYSNGTTAPFSSSDPNLTSVPAAGAVLDLQHSSVTVTYTQNFTWGTASKTTSFAITVRGVELDSGSDSGLVSGNKTITGLVLGKYYQAAEEETGTTYYVTAAGTLSKDLKDIGIPSGAAITGLTNGNTYKVNAAASFTAPLLYFDHPGNMPPADNPGTTLPVINSTIVLPAPDIQWGLSLPLDVSKTYEIMKFAISGGSSWTQSGCSGVYQPANTFTPDIPGKDVHIYQHTNNSQTAWLNGMSILLPATGTSEYIIAGRDGSLVSFKVTVLRGVIVAEGSDAGITGGNGKILGLSPDKYYTMTAGTTSTNIKYVTAAGTLSDNLKDIGRPSAGIITGLINDSVAYKVNAAAPFTGSLLYFDHDPEDGYMPPADNPGTTLPVINGTITFTDRALGQYGIDLALDIFKTYEIMKFAISGGSPWTESGCSGVYQYPANTFTPDIPGKETRIYQYAVNGVPGWINGMSILYAPVDPSETDYLVVDEAMNLLVLKVVVEQ